ncbi:Protein CBG16799 [Caenorhabditis briggsae]|uniref:Protein CBG16799 n=1 Tax=Caenorhabditis briggsae TaxID=6238 RepID=A8XPU2_CAEBR|nr:Protein CBG16799 [Caenorhabditis briggsae]CAP34668.1 Protein CBG16799 [Caenorhabditis briggsae]
MYSRTGPPRPLNQQQQEIQDRKQAKLEAERAKKAKELKEQKEQKENQKREWPDVTVDYNRELWMDQYKKKHETILGESVDIFVDKFEKMEKSQAEDHLLNILTKITFVENNLTVNGVQTVEKLFENLQKAASNESGDNPFKSIEELSEFLKETYFNFRKEVDEYRNIGVQSRRWIQFIKNKLDKGDIVDEDTFHDLYAEFQGSIPAGHEFARCEAPLDYTSLRQMGNTVPVFKYVLKLFLNVQNNQNPYFQAAIHGVIAPMKHLNAFEVLGVEVLPLSLENNLCTGSNGKIKHPDRSELRTADFGTVEEVLNANLKKSVSSTAKLPGNN